MQDIKHHHDHMMVDNLSARSSYNETPVQSPDANEYFGRWDSRTPSPADHQKVTFEEP